MSVLCPITDARSQRLLRAGVLVLICTLGGAIDVLNNSVALLAARIASFPEEEEHHAAKDRGSLIAAAQPARTGGLRPAAPTQGDARVATRPAAAQADVPGMPAHHRTLTGAGIFQHC
jgi:hypothetical protein